MMLFRIIHQTVVLISFYTLCAGSIQQNGYHDYLFQRSVHSNTKEVFITCPGSHLYSEFSTQLYFFNKSLDDWYLENSKQQISKYRIVLPEDFLRNDPYVYLCRVNDKNGGLDTFTRIEIFRNNNESKTHYNIH